MKNQEMKQKNLPRFSFLCLINNRVPARMVKSEMANNNIIRSIMKDYSFNGFRHPRSEISLKGLIQYKDRNSNAILIIVIEYFVRDKLYPTEHFAFVPVAISPVSAYSMTTMVQPRQKRQLCAERHEMVEPAAGSTFFFSRYNILVNLHHVVVSFMIPG